MRKAWQRLGGPNSVTVPGFFISAALGLLFALASLAAQGMGFNPLFIVPTLVGQLFAYGFLLLMRGTLLRSVNATRSLSGRTMIVFIVAGLLGIVGSQIAAMALDLMAAQSQSAPTPVQLVLIIASLFSGGLTLAVSAVIVDIWREHSSLVSQLSSAIAQLEYARTEMLAQAEASAEATRQEIAAALSAEMAALPNASRLVSAESLRALSHEVVRPASHALWSGSDLASSPVVSARRTDWRQYVVDATRLGVIAALPFALVTSALLAVYAAVVVEDVPALLVLVSEFVALFGVNLVINRVVVSARPEMTLVSGVPAREVTRRIGILALALGSSALVAMLVWRIVVSDHAAGAYPVLAVAVLLIGLMFTTFTAIRTANARDVNMMQDQRDSLQWHLARAREVERLNNQRLSRFLHGRIQAVLLSASARLESAASDGSQQSSDEIQSMLSDALSAMIAEDDDSFEFDVMIDELTQTWEGVARIECEMGTDVVLDAIAARTVYNVILEATSDAIKHARATVVDVSISSVDGDRVLVAVSNDGTAESAGSAGGASGLGSKLLDEVSIEWSRTREAECTVLRVVVPVAA